MKKLIVSAAFLALGASAYAAAIEQVIVRQQWPWSTDVKVEYKLSGVTAPVDIGVKAYNGSMELTLPESAVKGDRYGISDDGVGQLTIDPVAAFGTEKIALANFKVKLSVADSPAAMTEVIYKVFDLDDPTHVQDVRRADFYNGTMGSYVTDYSAFGSDFSSTVPELLIWTDVTNRTEYMTSKLVMRKIPAKGQIFTMGSGTSAHAVTLTNDYWMAVFPITCAQFDKLGVQSPYNQAGQGTMYANLTDAEKARCPRTLNNFKKPCRGDADWPSARHVVSNGTIIACLRAKLGVDFDEPTEAQWEFACRAGSTGTYYLNNVASYSDNQAHYRACKQLGWFDANSGNDSPLDLTSSASSRGYHPVGRASPNAYGLYDMLGNAVEECLDWYAALPTNPVTEPEGPATGTYRVVRGGNYVLSYIRMAVASRAENKSGPCMACRVMLPADLHFPADQK